MHNVTKWAIACFIVIVAWYGFSILYSTQMSPTQEEIDTVWNNIVALEKSGLIKEQLFASGEIKVNSKT